ncbi:MAG TPA: ABC transporter substrate-binding protein [Limnochordia bacterium]|nr:ABC transporter substrate-binding protein [Limnochordia bacterium]
MRREIWDGLGRVVVIAILASVTAWLAMRGFVPAYGAPDGPIGDGAARRELVVVVPEDALTLDPARFDRHAITESVHQLLYRRLLSREGVGFTLDLAQSIEPVDERTWRIQIKPGLKTPEGESYGAREVAQWLERLISPEGIDGFPSVARSRIGAIASVRAEGDTVWLHLSRPWPQIVAQLAREPIALLSPDGEVKPTGPFRVERWDRGNRIILSRVGPASRGEPTHIRIEVVSSAEERLRRVLTGSAHIGVALPPDALWRLQRAQGVKAVTVPQSRVHFVEFDVSRPPFNDVRVRLALNMAVDRHRLVETLLEREAVPVATLLSPVTYGFDSDVRAIPYDPQAAQRLLAEAGYPRGFDFELDTIPSKRRVAEGISEMLAEVGVTAFVRVWSDWSSLREAIQRENRQAWLGEWGNSSMDPAGALWPKLHSRGEANYGKYKDQTLDSMLEQAEGTLDPVKRLEAYREIQRYLTENAAMLYGYARYDIYGVDATLEWTPWPEGLLNLATAKWTR